MLGQRKDVSHEQMTLEPDIVERLKADFAEDHFPAALRLLTDSAIKGRVARCVILAAEGSLDTLRRLIEAASTDYRNAIFAGEYDCLGMQRIRDLSVSFLVDDPLDFWIGKLAGFFSSRGFHLVSLDSREATDGPFEYTSDHGEGAATFQSGDRTLTVIKENRQWRVIGEAAELRPFQLHIAYDDEDQLRNQLAWMLSSNRSGMS